MFVRMEPNVGDDERDLRLGVGLILLALALVFLWIGPFAWTADAAGGATGILLVGAIYLFVTAGTRKCPINALLDRGARSPE